MSNDHTDTDTDTDTTDEPEMPTPDPPMHDEWEGVETWSTENLRYPVPGGWEIDDHGRFHTTWKHADGTTLTRFSQLVSGDTDRFVFKLNGTRVHSVDAGPDRSTLREDTVWLLTLYDDREDIDSVDSFQVALSEQQNQSLTDFIGGS